jgi:hypothetical protein
MFVFYVKAAFFSDHECFFISFTFENNSTPSNVLKLEYTKTKPGDFCIFSNINFIFGDNLSKPFKHEELLKKISEQSFQYKMLSYQSNPFEVLKDKEIMTLMTSFFSENKNKN